MSPDIICYGASGHGKVVVDILDQAKVGRLVGFLDDDPRKVGTTVGGVVVLGRSDSVLQRVAAALIIVTIGENARRLHLAESLSSKCAGFATAVHPRACLAPGVVVGSGTVVMAGAIINPGAAVGAHVIVNTGASVDHDCVLEDGVHIAPGARLAGGVRVGSGAQIGIGAVVIPGISIGRAAVVGAGAVVIRDVLPGTTVVGNPADCLMRGVKGDT